MGAAETMSTASRAAPDTSFDDPAGLENVRPIPRISIQAFCESEAVARPIENAGADRRMAKTHMRVNLGGIRAAADYAARTSDEGGSASARG